MAEALIDRLRRERDELLKIVRRLVVDVDADREYLEGRADDIVNLADDAEDTLQRLKLRKGD